MRKPFFLLFFAVSIFSQPQPYFIDANDTCLVVLSIKMHDVKINVKYRTLSIESTMVCNNTCNWQYTYKTDSTYSVSYLTDFIAKIKITYSFFDSLNRTFIFKPSNFNQPIYVDSTWGDTISSPGYNKVLYAKITVPSVQSQQFLGPNIIAGIVGTLPEDTNITLKKTFAHQWGQNCSVLDSGSPPPQGKWNWIFTERSYCCNTCDYNYFYPASVGYNFSYLFNNDLILAYKDTSIQFIDTIKNATAGVNDGYFTTNNPLSLVELHSSTGIGYYYFGDLLCLETSYSDPGLALYTTTYKSYFVLDGVSINSMLTKTRTPAQKSNAVYHLNCKRLSNNMVRISYALQKSSPISLSLYSLCGREIAVLYKGLRSGGCHQENFSLPSLGNGNYIVLLKTKDFVESRNFHFIR